MGSKTMPDKRQQMAVKHDEELAKLEEEVAAQLSEPKEEEAQVEQEDEETSTEESAPEETKPPVEEPQEPKPEAEGKEEGEFQDEDVDKLSDKAQKRFRQMVDKIKELEAEKIRRERYKFDKPEEVKEQPKEPVREPTFRLPWDKAPQEDPAVIARNTAREETQRTIQEERVGMWLEQDLGYVETQYPELNPSSPEYDKELDFYLEDAFKAKIKADSSYRLKDHVDSFMNQRKKAEKKAMEKVRLEKAERLSKQKSEQAVVGTTTVDTPEPKVEDKLWGVESIKDLEKLEAEVNRAAKR